MEVGGIKFEPLNVGTTLPMLCRPLRRGIDLKSWIGDHEPTVDGFLCEHGAILFRDFEVEGAGSFRRIALALAPQLQSYDYQSTPRTQAGEGIYTASEYPARSTIPLHNEESYNADWPLRIMFYCVQPAEKGGKTPIAYTPSVTKRIPAAVMDRFESLGVLYVRNLQGQRKMGFDLPWQTVFQTDDKVEVEARCRQYGIETEWISTDTLRTRQLCQALAEHPVTGEFVWFNQAHLFHSSRMKESIRASLVSLVGEARLPRNSFYGDESRIDSRDIDAIMRAFNQEAVRFPWQRGDILLLDNMLASHGRMPFEGQRQVLVAMGGQFSATGARIKPER